MGLSFFRANLSEQAALLGGTDAGVPQSAVIMASRLTGLYGTDFALYLGRLEDMIEAARQPYPDAIRLAREGEDRVLTQLNSSLGRFKVFSRSFLPALAKTFSKESQTIARLRAAQTALGVEHYRQTHDGHLPEDLKVLVPDYLSIVPTDPFDGRPLELGKLAEGYRVLCPAASLEAPGRGRSTPPEPVGFTVRR